MTNEEMLEERTTSLFGEVDELKRKVGAQSKELTFRITEEVIEIKAELGEIGEKLETAVVGDIHLEWRGVTFFFLGIILASASPELCVLLGKAGLCG